MTRFKTLAIAAVAATTLSLATAPKAEARYFPWGAVAAGAIVGGAALAIAGSRAHAEPVYGYGDCYTVRRWVDTPYGPALRRVRVCE
ncbi:hypothetical protein [Phreatobacter stygius]|uniref:Uncharacterized protein n=1 Tax=Phreatobacter stygius TaxID=1940610 RepID=A0A4D7B522_9HYPH|nr:hypothetical protein [Phreatobacter stygius]QCI66103.1 hypothetical protein E8M01_18950 [Phreatobacter stygius]